MKVKKNCLVAHSQEINVKMSSVRNKVEMVTVKGPGLVYIDMQEPTRIYKTMQISFFLLLMYVGVYFIFLYVVSVERYKVFNDYK
jgi:hypothetical protein